MVDFYQIHSHDEMLLPRTLLGKLSIVSLHFNATMKMVITQEMDQGEVPSVCILKL